MAKAKRPLMLYRFPDGIDPGKAQAVDSATDGRDYRATPLEVVNPLAPPSETVTPQVVSSELADTVKNHHRDGNHVVAIDVDLPCHLIETSPGHHHLVIEREMSWARYRALLVALAEADIIERGFLEACLERRASHLRIHPGTPLQVLQVDDHAEPF